VLRNESQAVNAAKNARGAQTTEILNQIAPYLATARATFLTGDFNEPSHLDWTTAAANAGLHPFKVAWPASSAVVAKGFRDSYRQINTNEVTKPGNTWTPDPGPNEVHDRIDFVFVAGTGASATATQIVGENATHADIVVSSYPSDHRAVVSTFSIPSASLAPVRKGINLISNAGAEATPGAAASADRVLTDWETSQNNTVATAQLYGKAGYAPAFSASGVNYFYGGVTGSTAASQHSIAQTIGVSELAAEIDASQIAFDLSGYFGGFDTQNDTAALKCDFLSASGAVLASATIGDVTAQNRKNVTKLLLRSATGTVPAQTRTARLTLTFKKIADGTFNDGSADNLSLILRNP